MAMGKDFDPGGTKKAGWGEVADTVVGGGREDLLASLFRNVGKRYEARLMADGGHFEYFFRL